MTSVPSTLTTRSWVRAFRFGPVQVRLTLLKHTYRPGDVRWVIQTSTAIDHPRG